jgi:exosortase family protein XrtF
MKPLFKDPLTRFLLSIFGFYIAWFPLYNFLLKKGERIDLFVIDITISASKWLLELLGYSVFTATDRVIGIDGTGGLWIGDNCNGISLFAIFAGYIIAYPGNLRKKLVFIPAGILLIQLLNILRIVILSILDTHSRAWTEFNHTYTFNIIIYGFIFLMWMFWTSRFASGNLFINKGKEVQ